MTYSLGVDLGTTFVAAAICRSSGSEMVTLSGRSVVAPAWVYLREDDVLVTGEAAQLRALTAPGRVVREVKRRLGDPTPTILGGQPFDVTTLLAAQLRDVLDLVGDLEGGNPERVALTHPANWGGFRRGLFEEVPVAAGLRETITLTEPEAAAAHYAMSRQLKDGQIVAVYDLGGGTFDATILRGGADGVEILGRPEGIERLGGVDFDESILGYVNFSLGGALDELDPHAPAAASAAARLRQDCVQAKESLSMDSETIIPVYLPGRHTEVRLTRKAFEDMIRAPLESTIGALLRTVHSADLQLSDLSAVLLVGGSSRIPLVAEEISRQLGCKTMVDTHPKYAVALGAAALAAKSLERPAVPTIPPRAATATPTPSPAPPQHAPPSARAPEFTAAAARASRIPSPTARSAAPELSGGWPGLPPDAVASKELKSGGATPGARARVRLLGIVGAALLFLALAGLGYALWPDGHRGSNNQPGVVAAADKAKPAPAASLATPTVAGSFPVAAAPQAGAITPDGKLAYITSTATNSITIVDLATNATVDTIPISAGPPQYVAFTPDGRHAYVSVYDQIRQAGNVVVIIDTTTRSITGSIPTQKFPYALTVSPDGQQLFIPNHDFPAITVADTKTNTVTQTIAVKPSPHSVAFSGDGRRAYVANHFSNLVTVLDTQNGAILAEIPAGRSPHSIAMAPDRAAVYVVDYDGNTVTVINPITNTVTATIPVGLEPQSVAFAPDSKHAYIVNDGNNTVSIIDTTTTKVTATLTVGQDPTNVFVAPDGKHAYITNISSNNVTVLKTG